MHFRRTICLLLGLLGFAGCSGGGTPAEAVADAVKNQPDVKAFAQLFPDAEHFITHYSGTSGPRIWNSHVLLHERYVLHMHVDMALDDSGVKVTAKSPPKYYLREVTNVSVMPPGQISGSYGESM